MNPSLLAFPCLKPFSFVQCFPWFLKQPAKPIPGHCWKFFDFSPSKDSSMCKSPNCWKSLLFFDLGHGLFPPCSQVSRVLVELCQLGVKVLLDSWAFLLGPMLVTYQTFTCTSYSIVLISTQDKWWSDKDFEWVFWCVSAWHQFSCYACLYL